MKEFEISFRVDEPAAYLKFIRSVKPRSQTKSTIERSVYKSESQWIARITKVKTGTYCLDFKEDTPDAKQLEKHVVESVPIPFAAAKLPLVKKLLQALDYKKSVSFKKSRTSFMFQNFRVDVDEYLEPEKAWVIEIEGDPQAARIFYQKLQATLTLSA
ncbi:hypothetical protein HY346_02000 [Candidatus Microgenomates bacterium]|nr:hypothetical protein [Candidatus Microgenomates bacterium]